MARKRISRRRNSKKYRTVKRRSKWRQLKTRSHTMRVKGGRKRRKNRKMNKSRKIFKGGAASTDTVLNMANTDKVSNREQFDNGEPLQILPANLSQNAEKLLGTMPKGRLWYGIVELDSGSSIFSSPWIECLFTYEPLFKNLYCFNLKNYTLKKKLIVVKAEREKNNDTRFKIVCNLGPTDPHISEIRCQVKSKEQVDKWINILSSHS